MPPIAPDFEFSDALAGRIRVMTRFEKALRMSVVVVEVDDVGMAFTLDTVDKLLNLLPRALAEAEKRNELRALRGY